MGCCCRWWRTSYTKSGTALEQLEEKLASLVKVQKQVEQVSGGDNVYASAGGTDKSVSVVVDEMPADWKDRLTHPLQPPMPMATWVQSIFNTLWLVQQLTALKSGAERRKYLNKLAPTAPFLMPLMVVVPYTTLKRLGKFPRRDTSMSDEERGWRVRHSSRIPQHTASHRTPKSLVFVVGESDTLHSTATTLCPLLAHTLRCQRTEHAKCCGAAGPRSSVDDP